MVYLFLWYDSMGKDLRSEWMSSKGSLALEVDGGNDLFVILPWAQPGQVCSSGIRTVGKSLRYFLALTMTSGEGWAIRRWSVSKSTVWIISNSPFGRDPTIVWMTKIVSPVTRGTKVKTSLSCLSTNVIERALPRVVSPLLRNTPRDKSLWLRSGT